MSKTISKAINFFENQPVTFSGWVVSFFTLLGLNLFFQAITYGFKNVSAEYLIGEIIQPYYFILYFGVVIFLYFITKSQESIKLKPGIRRSRVYKVKNLSSQTTRNQKQKVKKLSHQINENQNDIKKILNFVLWGFWSIIFWPIIDKIILGNRFHLSFYIYDNFSGVWHDLITFFGPINSVGILYGTRLETIFIVLFVGIYVYYKRNSVLRAVLAGIGVYVIFFISVALPSILVFIIEFFRGNSILEITKLDIVKFFNTPLQYFGVPERGFAVTFFYKISLIYNLIFVILLGWLQFLWDKKIFFGLLKNIRLPQMIFNWGLLLVGILIGGYYWSDNLVFNFWSIVVLINLFLAILFSWLFSVVINDIEDFEIDKISNKQRPLVIGLINKEEYFNYGLVFLFLSLLFSVTISGKIFILIVLYNLVTVIYSKYPFKLKRIPLVSGIISSLASLLIFLIGYILISSQQSLDLFPWKFVLFLFSAYALILPIKDLKDLKSDKQNGIITIAGLLGERIARMYFGLVVFVLYILSVFVFGFYNIFYGAIICGGVSYWIINNSKNFRNILLYKLLGVVLIYVLAVILL